jgi:hypothetical protein
MQLVCEVARMFVVDASALLVVTVGTIAALPAYDFTRRSGRDRARSTIAYLSGLAGGPLAAVVLFQVLQALNLNFTFAGASLTRAFLGPIAGLLWGVWVRTGRKKRSPLLN